jgi:hypothetical protein
MLQFVYELGLTPQLPDQQQSIPTNDTNDIVILENDDDTTAKQSE